MPRIFAGSLNGPTDQIPATADKTELVRVADKFGQALRSRPRAQDGLLFNEKPTGESMKRLLVIPTVFVFASIMFAAPPANAALPSCPSGFLCVYVDINGQGSRYTWLGGDMQWNFNDGTKFPSGTKLNDNISSIYNNSGYNAKFCTDANLKGHCLAYPAYSYASHVTYSDQYSSYTTI